MVLLIFVAALCIGMVLAMDRVLHPVPNNFNTRLHGITTSAIRPMIGPPQAPYYHYGLRPMVNVQPGWSSLNTIEPSIKPPKGPSTKLPIKL